MGFEVTVWGCAEGTARALLDRAHIAGRVVSLGEELLVYVDDAAALAAVLARMHDIGLRVEAVDAVDGPA